MKRKAHHLIIQFLSMSCMEMQNKIYSICGEPNKELRKQMISLLRDIPLEKVGPKIGFHVVRELIENTTLTEYSPHTKPKLRRTK